MSIDHGMNIDDIEGVGRRLQQHFAVRLEEIANEVESVVGQTSNAWIGADAERFRGWWPAKRTLIRAAAEDIRGFGQSALNNAAEQRTASDAAAGGAAPPSVRSGGTVSESPSQGTGTSRQGELPGANRSASEATEAYNQNWLKYGLYAAGAPGGSLDYECVSWAWFRLRELGYEGPQVSGNGIDVAGRLGGTTTTIPEPGAVMSFGYPPGAHEGWEYGHVVVAESVTTNSDGKLEVRVSEMNVWRGEGPAKYSDSKTFIQGADGTWSDSLTGATRTITVANPRYTSPQI